MALTTCPECNGQVSTTAPHCPHCGYTPPAQAPEPASSGGMTVGGVIKWGLFGLLGLMAVSCFISIGSVFDDDRHKGGVVETHKADDVKRPDIDFTLSGGERLDAPNGQRRWVQKITFNEGRPPTDDQIRAIAKWAWQTQDVGRMWVRFYMPGQDRSAGACAVADIEGGEITSTFTNDFFCTGTSLERGRSHP